MDKEKKQRLIVTICCFIASFCLWLYISNVENPLITYKIKNIPVELKNVDYIEQYKLTLIPEEGYYVDLMIKGAAAEVYNISSKDFKIVADMSAYVLKNGENRIPVEIKQSPDDMSIMQSGNLWVQVILDELIQKNVPVEIDVKGTPKSEYHAGKPIVKPTEVPVYGAAQYVNAVEKVTAEVNVDGAKQDIQVSLALKAVDVAHRTLNEVKLQTNFADVVVPIKKIKYVDIKVNTIGAINKEYILKSIKADIDKLAIIGDEEVVSKINILETEVIDLSTIMQDTSAEISVILPRGIKLLENKSGIKVDIDIEKNVDKSMIYPIKIKNYDKQYKVELGEENVTISIRGEESVIKEINLSDIHCNVDLKGMQEGEYLLPVNVLLPEHVKLISKSPDVIKVTVYKKQADDEGETDGDIESETDSEAVDTKLSKINKDDTEVPNDNKGE